MLVGAYRSLQPVEHCWKLTRAQVSITLDCSCLLAAAELPPSNLSVAPRCPWVCQCISARVALANLNVIRIIIVADCEMESDPSAGLSQCIAIHREDVCFGDIDIARMCAFNGRTYG